MNPDTLGNESNGSVEQPIDTETPVQDEAPRLLRSKSQPYFKELCIICQQQGGKLHKVETIHIGQRMLKVAKELPDQSFCLRMNSIPNSADAVANDVQYHLKCWILAERSTQVNPDEIQIFDDTERVVADIEIIEIIRMDCNESKIMNMNNLNKTYNNLLGNCDAEEVNYKRYLKALLEDNIPGITFPRPPNRRQSEQFCSTNLQAKAVDEAMSNHSDDFSSIYQAAKVIRKELLKHRNWKFDGDFSDFEIPNSLKVMLKWVIIGPQTEIDSNLKKKNLDTRISNIAQIVMKAAKSKRQVNYKSSTDTDFREVVETLFSVGVGIHLHKETRNKKVINFLSDLGLSISYKRVLKIENGLTNAVVEKITTNGGVFVPSNLELGKKLHFAIDNIDFNSATNLSVAKKQKPFLDSMFSPDVIKLVDSLVKESSLGGRNS